MSLFEELKRRNVFRVGLAYVLMGWVLLQGADFVLDLVGAPDWVIRAFAVLVAIGLPVALFFAWAFELTPEGIKREAEVDRSRSVTPTTGRKLDRAIIVLLAAAVAILLVDRYRGTESGQSHRAGTVETAVAQPDDPPPASSGSPAATKTSSVAVLPFRAMSSGPDDEYFADGLTEEILNTLTQLPELLVTARTSSFHFKGRDLPVPDIANQLGVAHVVEGSVRRAGAQVRITAQLIRAEDGFHLWSQTYDRTLENVFSVQEDIAASIAETLDVVLDEDKLALMRRSGIGDINAFIAFQKGRDLFTKAHDAESGLDIENSISAIVPYFEKTLAVSPGLLAASIYKSDFAAHVAMNIASGAREERFPGEAEQAIAAIRNELGLAWENARPGHQRDILDVERTLFEDDWTGMAQKMRRALRPGDCPRDNWMTEFATTMVSPELVLRFTGDQLRCDPLNGLVIFNHALGLVWAGDPDEAIRLSEEAIELGVDFNWLDGVKFAANLALGNFDDPTMDTNDAVGWFPYSRSLYLAAANGSTEKAARLARESLDDPVVGDWSTLVVAAITGNRELANATAARIDALPGGFLVLNNATFFCLCGSPFELEATPNFSRRLAEAGLVWSPENIIRYPAKDW